MPVVNEITEDRLRELAATREQHGKVLSLYVNLDPQTFATPPARDTEISAVLDEADRTLRDEARLGHDEREMLKADLERARTHLRSELDTNGARGIAIFASGGGDRLEVVKLPRPVDHAVAIGDGPFLEPLARIGARERWWVVLVDRRRARLFEGTLDGLAEVWNTEADHMHDQHDQGGWSQARYQRSVDREVEGHLKAVSEELYRRFKKLKRIDGLLLGGPTETVPALEGLIHPEMKGCLVSQRVEVDVGNGTNHDDVLKAAAPILQRCQMQRIRDLLDRVDEGLATEGRAAAGLADVLRAVNERRVETLLVHEGFSAAGQRCPRCGILSIDIGGACPVDGAVTEPVGDVVEAAIEATWSQDAAVKVVVDDELDRQHGRVAAVLRF
ncbi:Vms1/Ankzf1 family peptidyl-tRNA hydrolase [Conexibacter sp. SYSU D00693]|uniref:baeRF10 domain-containing protein n=1 Tax=Conexibacter sp. SYSU D00693 TaxID=2812560 RepID=UPI00196A622E|nr:Vms1/Ankzf1 family peptidyl-tRNA hydrolase [Conexibacter sp. SYSU D00693]